MNEIKKTSSGQAATSILLLQDLAVAPILVLLPFIVGRGETDYNAIAFLTAKATIGFGSVVFAGSYLLQKVFNFVAQTRSTETFVALCLLVSVGMGSIAKALGLTDTAGAFVAGVLLANTNYRAQIQADILPFKGILLGIFFMDAGSSFDSDIFLNEFPTVITGAAILILLKAITIFSSTKVPEWMEPNRLPVKDAIRLSWLLAGGGEFAFVVLALAEKLEVLPSDLGGLLTAIVLITMGVTPLLGQAAEILSGTGDNEPIDVDVDVDVDVDRQTDLLTGLAGSLPLVTPIAEDAVVICGYQEIGQALLRELDKGYKQNPKLFGNLECTVNSHELPHIVAFDTEPSVLDMPWNKTEPSFVSFGDASKPQVLRSSGISEPRAIFITFTEHEHVLSTILRLRPAFPEAPIYARALSTEEAQALKAAGATDVVVEANELPQSALALLAGNKGPNLFTQSTEDNIKRTAATVSGFNLSEIEKLFEIYECLDHDNSGLLDHKGISSMLRISNSGIISDKEIEAMEIWIKETVRSPIDTIEFCKVYAKAPEKLRQALQDACLLT